MSKDPDFEAKLVDVVGLYLDPPERAVVFSFDEKTQCQALDRTQPSLPLKPGRAKTMTHDYKRNGTIDLFAALNVATGEVIHRTWKRHAGVIDDYRVLASPWGFEPEAIQMHVDFWHGDEDRMVAMSEAQAVAARMANSTFTIVSGAGHLLLMDHLPDVFTALAP